MPGQNQPSQWMDSKGRDEWVSVIVPTYNRAQILSGALSSVYDQTYRPIELIVVDDGSTDRTALVVENWAENRSGRRFKVEYCFQENAGPSAARNRGLLVSSGEYIQFLDSDDRLHPQKLSVHTKLMELDPPCDAVVGNNMLFDLSQGSPDFAQLNEDKLLGRAERVFLDSVSLLNGNLVNGLYRRGLPREAGPIREELRWMEDVEYNIRMSASVGSVRKVDASLLAFSRHGGDHLTNVRNRPEGFDVGFAAVQAMENTVNEIGVEQNGSIRRTIGNFYMGLAHLALRVEKPEGFRKALEAALRNRTGRPFRIKASLLSAVRLLLGNELTHRAWGYVSNFDTTQRTA